MILGLPLIHQVCLIYLSWKSFLRLTQRVSLSSATDRNAEFRQFYIQLPFWMSICATKAYSRVRHTLETNHQELNLNFRTSPLPLSWIRTNLHGDDRIRTYATSESCYRALLGVSTAGRHPPILSIRFISYYIDITTFIDKLVIIKYIFHRNIIVNNHFIFVYSCSVFSTFLYYE